MNKIEYQTNILENGQIRLPKKIMKKHLLKPRQKIKVTIEVTDQPGKTKKVYSFMKVRKLLQGIKEDMSHEIISDREDRI